MVNDTTVTTNNNLEAIIMVCISRNTDMKDKDIICIKRIYPYKETTDFIQVIFIYRVVPQFHSENHMIIPVADIHKVDDNTTKFDMYLRTFWGRLLIVIILVLAVNLLRNIVLM
ncbi:MAG: hypothetical protein COA82_03525 [Alkaliphilus sp.]|nr:MAG: hypothetical protein COA82_03525 [Alkaliphilus sp.]